MDEVFRSLTDGIWSDLDRLSKPATDKAAKVVAHDHPPQPSARVPAAAEQHGPGQQCRARTAISTATSSSSRGGNAAAPADARALARLHLKEIAGRIGKVLETSNPTIDDTSRAHLEECRHRIAKVLEANLDVREP